MVEIFKTNVQKKSEASLVIAVIEQTFPGSCATFDLEDCDHVLRVHAAEKEISCESLIRIVADMGFNAEVLGDIPYSFEGLFDIFHADESNS
jgi:hypothetical protein